MKTVLTFIVLMLMLFTAGCNNPSGGSVVDPGHSPGLIKPGPFTLKQIVARKGKISLIWNGAERVASYHVKYGTSSTSTNVQATCSSPLATSCDITGLTNGTTYYVKVIARNDAGESEVATTAIPIGPFEITSSVVLSNQITITWTPAAGANKYTLRYGTSPGSYPKIINNISASPYVLTGVQNGVRYYFKIVASNSKYGLNDSDSEDSAIPDGPPAAPIGLNLSPGDAQVSLSWNNVGGASSYKIFRGTTSGSLSQISTVTTSSYTDTGVSNGTIYYYAVKSSNGAFDSDLSTEYPVKAIENFAMTSVVAGPAAQQLTVTWPAAAGADQYNIHYGTSPGNLNLIATNKTSPAVLTGLAGGVTYYVRVRALNSVGQGAAVYSTNTIDGTTIEALNPPTGITISVSPGSNQINWNSVSGAMSYEVLRGTVSGSYSSLQTGIIGNSYTDNTAANGTAYYYVVRTYNGLYSVNSAEVAGKPIEDFAITTLTPLSNTSLRVTWPAVTGADAYDVRYGTVSGSLTATATGVTSPYTITGLSANTTYYVSVRARNAIGTGANRSSPEVSEKTLTATPTGLSATTSPGKVTLSWTATTGATTYKVFRGTISGTLSEIANSIATISYEDTTVTDGVTYFYAIRANNGNDSAQSSEVSARSIAAFSITSAVASSTTSIVVTWPATAGAATYDIKYGTASGSHTTTLTNRTSPSTVASLTAGQRYYFVVVGKNTVGSTSSETTAEVSETTQPAIPTGVAATAADGAINLTWSTVSGASSYKVFRGTTSGSLTELANGITSNNYNDNTVVDGTRYFYALKAFNGNDSALSSEVSAKTIADFNIDTLTAPSATSIQVAWTNTAGGDTYDVRYGTVSGSYTNVNSVTSPRTVSSLAANTTYYVRVRANNAIGTGANKSTPELSIKTPTTAPAGLAATPIPGQIDLTWSATTGATSYNIYRGTISGTHALLASGVVVTNYTDATVVNGTQYYYVVRANNGAESASSSEVTARTIPNHTISSTSSPSSTTIQVNWGAVTGASTYDVGYGTTSGSYTFVNGVTSPYTITGRTANTNYFIVVRAKNAIGSGASVVSTEVSQTTATVAPTGLVASASPGQVGLNWNATAGATSYKVYRNTIASTPVLLASDVTGTAYLDTTVSDGTTYYYSLRAVNGSDSALSSEIQVRPIGSFSLSSVTTLSATSLSITWGAATGAASYDVRYGTSSGVYLTTVSGVTSTYTLTGLTANTQYFVSVRAKNSVGAGTEFDSNEMNSTTATLAPTGLAASTTTGQVDLTWNATAGATSYKIYRSTTSGSYGAPIATGVSSTSYSDTSITDGTIYFYVVRATNGSDSANSNEISARSVAGFSIANTSSPSTTSIQVSWNAAAGATAYDVKYGTSTGSYTTTLTNQVSPYTITGLTTNTTYYIVVTGRNSTGSGANATTSEVSQITAISAPTGLAASATPGAVNLNWTTHAQASSYKIYRGTSTGSYSEIATGVATNSYNNTGLTNGTTYFYAIKAFNGADSAYSSEVSIRPIANFVISALPTSTTTIDVTWPAVAGAATYDLHYGTSSGSYTTTLTGVSSGVTLTGLSAGQQYYIKVTAKNSIGAGTQVDSPEVNSSTAFNAPTGVTASSSPGQVTISWSAVVGATEYKVYRSLTSGSGFSEIANGLTSTTYNDTGVSNGTSYFYFVRAYNGAAPSPDSLEVSARPISSFTLSSVTATSSSTLDVTWTAATGATAYDVRYGTSSGNYTTTVSGVSSTYTINSLAAGTTYYVIVRARNAVGSGASVDSNEVVTPTSPAAPGSPSATATTGQIALSWSAATGATSYNVYRSTTSTSYGAALVTGIGTTTYTDTSVVNGTQYYYVIRASNGTESVNSSEVTGKSIAAFNISSTSAPSSTSITVNFPSTNGGDTYDVRWGTSSGSYPSQALNQASPYTITGLTQNTTYYIVVRANNAVGSGSSAQTAQVIQITPLGAPTGLAATATPGQVALTWNSVAGASSYYVYRSTTSGSGYSAIATGVAGTSYNDTSVSNGTQYYYVVRSYNGAESANSSEVTRTPMANFSVASTSAPTSATVDVTWNALNGAESYDVRWGTTSGTYTNTVTSVSSPYTITGLSANTTYFIVVRANNTIGGGAGTSVTSSQTSQKTPTAAPTGLTASASPTQVGLNWNAVTGATTYKVWRGTSPGVLSEIATGIATTAYVDTGLTNGQTYYYAVKANNGADSALSSEVAVQPIGTFTLSSVTAVTANRIDITWSAATGATSYDIRYGTSSGVYLFTATGATSTYQLTGLTQGTQYFISVRAKNAVGAGTNLDSNEMNATTSLGAPTGLAASATPGSVSLTWTGNGASSYKIYRSTTSGSYGAALATGITPASYTDNTAVNGTIYYYVVRAFNGTDSVNSTEVSIKPIASFSLTAATGASSSSINLTWGAANGADTYDVRYGTSPGTYTGTATNQTSVATVTGLATNTLYYVAIRANNSQGTGTTLLSNELSVRTATAAPTSLAISNVTPGQINMTWSAATGATSYKVYRGTTSGVYAEIASGVSVTNYQDNTVSNGTPYFYVVRGFNGTESGNSNEVSAQAISNFTIASTSAPSTTSITVNWNPVSGATSYDVLRCATSMCGSPTIVTGVSSGYTITGLTANTTYFIRVRAKNSVGGYSATVDSTEASQKTPVAAPSGLTATGGVGQVSLSWSAVTGATSYKIYRGTSSGNLSTEVATGVVTTTYNDTGLSNGTTYYYGVKSFNGADSAMSSEVFKQPMSSFSISSITGGSSSITVSWGSSTGATSYDINYGTSPGSYGTTITGATSPANITGLSVGTTYYVRVQAKNTVGGGSTVNSAESSGTPNSPPVLSSIANQSTEADVPKAVNFTLTDSNHAVSCTTSMSGSSSNTTLVPNGNIVFSGTAPNCTVTITPATAQTGTSNITLSASDGVDVTQRVFQLTVTPCVVASITWTTQPGNITAGNNWGTAPRVTLRKADNSVCTTNTAPVSLFISNDASTMQDATVSGTFSVTPVNGVATFSAATVTRAASGHTIAATQDGVTSADSNTFNVSALSASKVFWSLQPTTTNRTMNISPAPTLQTADMYDNPVTANGISITVSLQDNDEGATLSGTLTRSTSSGQAVFTGLSLNVVGSYYLRATPANGWAAVDSNFFNILQIITQNVATSMEMINGSLVHTGVNTNYLGAGLSFGTNHVDGTINYTWKIVATNTDNQNSTVRLRVGTTNILSITVPSNTSAPTMYSATIAANDVPAEGIFSLRIEKGTTTIYSSRIIAVQSGATRTQLVIPLTSTNNSTTATQSIGTASTSMIVPSEINFPAYYWVNNKFSRIESILLTATARAGGCVQLFNKDTDTAIGSEICSGSGSDAVVSVPIDKSLMPSTGMIEARMRSNSGTAYVTKASLIVRIVSVEKVVVTQRVAPAVDTLTATTNFVEQRASSYKNSYGSGTVYEYFRCKAKANSGGSSAIWYKNHGSNTSGVTSPTNLSSVTYTSESSFTDKESGPNTTNNNNQFATYTHTSGSFALSHCLYETEVVY